MFESMPHFLAERRDVLKGDPERGDEFLLKVVSVHPHLVPREAVPEMLEVQKGVVEVERGDVVVHVGVVSRGGVSIPEDDVMEPVGDDAVRVHHLRMVSSTALQLLSVGFFLMSM